MFNMNNGNVFVDGYWLNKAKKENMDNQKPTREHVKAKIQACARDVIHNNMGKVTFEDEVCISMDFAVSFFEHYEAMFHFLKIHCEGEYVICKIVHAFPTLKSSDCGHTYMENVCVEIALQGTFGPMFRDELRGKYAEVNEYPERFIDGYSPPSYPKPTIPKNNIQSIQLEIVYNEDLE